MWEPEEIEWHIENRLIKDLKPHAKNPRKMSKHDAENLEKKIKKFGLIDKPIIDLNNQIIGGHQRINLYKKMKRKEIQCWVPDRPIPQEDVDELNIGLNRAQGEWDYDILGNQWEDQKLLEGGFTEQEICMSVETPPEGSQEGKKSKKKMCPACGHEF